MKKILFAATLVTALAFSSCSPFQVRSDYSVTANFNDYRTYKLRVDDLKLNDLDKDRVLNELSKQLKSKGLQPGENPDLIINIKANHKKVTDIRTNTPVGIYGGFGLGGGFDWGFGMNRAWSSNYNQGSLVFDFIETKTQKLVWQGIGSGISVDQPSSKRKQIPEIVEEMMKNYPPKK